MNCLWKMMNTLGSSQIKYRGSFRARYLFVRQKHSEFYPQHTEDRLKNSNFSFNRNYGPNPILNIPHTGIFKEYVTEALLYDEKTKNRIISADFETNNQRILQLMKEVAIKDGELATKETQLGLMRDQKRRDDLEIAEMKKNNMLFRVENDELIKIIDVKDLKIQELLNMNQALENDNIHKKSLLREKQEFFKKQFMNSILESQKKVYEDEISNLKLKIDQQEEYIASCEQKLSSENATNKNKEFFEDQLKELGLPSGLATGTLKGQTQAEDGNSMEKKYEAVIELLRRQLADKEKYLRKENPLDFMNKESTISELLVKGYSRENERLLGQCQDLKTMLIDKQNDNRINTKHNAFSENTFRFDQEDQMKETIQRLQEELKRKDENYRSKETFNKDKLDKCDDMKREIDEKVLKVEELEKNADNKDKQIHELNLKMQEIRAKAAEHQKNMNVEVEKTKKEAAKKETESNRVRDENILLRKEMKNLREKIQNLETETASLKLKKDNTGDLAKKITNLNGTIKDLQDKLKNTAQQQQVTKPTPNQKSPTYLTPSTSKKVQKNAHLEEKPKSINDWKDTLNTLLREERIPDDLKEQIHELSHKIDKKDKNQETNSKTGRAIAPNHTKVPIKKDIDILDSDQSEPGEYDEKIYAIDIDEEFEKQREDIPEQDTRYNNGIRGNGDDFDKKKKLIKAIVSNMPKTNQIVGLERHWSKISDYYLPNEPDKLKDQLTEYKRKVMECESDIGQEEIVPYLNRGINLSNRGDSQGVQETVLHLDRQTYDYLFETMPRILENAYLGSGQSNFEDMKRELMGVQREKEMLEEVIRQTPVSPKDVDFAILQRKIDMMEQQQRMREMETVSSLKHLLDNGQEEKEWRREKEKMIHIIKSKNREITRFRQEVDELVLKLKELRAANRG